MRKKILSLLTAFLCAVFVFSGCQLGSYIENGSNNPSTGNNPTTPGGEIPGGEDDPPVDTSEHYRANVIYNNQRFYPGDLQIYVVWRNDYDIQRVELSADGTADAGVLDGDYSVYLEGLPSKYAYNPNATKATDDERFVSIFLTDILEPDNATRADGKGLYVNTGCYELKYDGVYRTYLKNENDKTYYEYTPLASGYYSITSWVNVYEDRINPKLQQINGTVGYKWEGSLYDGGGASLSGGHTKNFRYEVRISQSSVGASFSFAIMADCKFPNDYPVYVDFEIKYEGAYTSGNENVREKRAEEQLIQAQEPKINERFVWADLGSKTFDMSNFKFCDEDNRYHFYNMNLYGDDPYGYGAGYGPILLCAIRPSIPSYSITTLYNANSVGINKSNFLMIYNMWFEDEQAFGVYNYENFIRVDYAGVCNSQGYCYVTRELKEFLYLFSSDKGLYTDGSPLDGTPEANGYHAYEDALWLFACGFYYPGGQEALLGELAKYN